MNIGGIILHKILEDPKHETSLEAWGKLKLNFFTSEYRPIYTYLSNFYTKNTVLPSFDDVKVTNRNSLLGSNIRALEKLEVDENIDILIACSALLDEYTQDQTLKRVDTLIDNITFLDTEEIKSELGNMVLELEEETFDNQHVLRMNNMELAKEDEIQGERIFLGVNNTFDSEIMAKTQEYILIGGYVGSGKSTYVINACVNQYLQNFTSVFFTIEMPAQEVFERMMSILSGVDYGKIRRGTFEEEELVRLGTTRKNMFQNSEDVYNEFLKDFDLRKLETNLNANKKLTENQIIIIDNPRLTLTNIDMELQKLKARFGNRFRLGVVDYLNQIEIADQYNWSQQIFISKSLKGFARKHDLLMLSPFQIDEKKGTRFSKGIKDSADMVLLLTAEDKYIMHEFEKARGNAKLKPFYSGVNWSTQTINPEEYIVVEEEEENDTREKPRKQGKEDLPW